MKIVYEADDGTRFNTQLECRCYEEKNELYSHIAQYCKQHNVDDAEHAWQLVFSLGTLRSFKAHHGTSGTDSYPGYVSSS